MKFNFVRYVLTVFIATILIACGGGGGGGSTDAGAGPGGNSSGLASGPAVFGVAATGLAINGSVTLKDAKGNTRTAVIAQPSGEFSIDVTGLTAPYFLKATDSTGTTSLYSVAMGTGNFNINPISNLVVVAAAMSIDPLAKAPEAAFSNPSSFSNLNSSQVQAAVNSVMAQMSPAFQAALITHGAQQVNPLTDTFQVGKGLDKVFDNYAITLDTATGVVQERQVVSNTTTSLGLVDKFGAFAASGIYSGTVTMQLSRGGIHMVNDAVITPFGEIRYVMDNGVQVIGSLTINGTTVTGTGKAFAPTQTGQSASFLFGNGSAAVDVVFNGTLVNGTFTGSYTYAGYSDSFSFTLNQQQTSTPSSLAKIAGTYVSSSESNTSFIGHIEATGAIWGSGPDIAYSGLIQVLDPNTNLYRVTLAYLDHGTYGYETGLAVFNETSPTTCVLPLPTAIVPDNYTADLSSLGYSNSVTGCLGQLFIQLSNPTLQHYMHAFKLRSQLQSVAVKPTSTLTMVQAIGNSAFSITSSGDVQFSSSGPKLEFSGNINAAVINLIPNPGTIILNGATINVELPKPGTPISGTQGGAITTAGTSPWTQVGGSVINWNSFNISSGSTVNFVQPVDTSLHRITPTIASAPLFVTGTLSSNMPSGTITVTGTGSIILNGINTFSGSIPNFGTGTITVSGQN